MYYDTLDPFACLAGAAAVTSHLRLATGIALVVQRDPIHTAKDVSTIDILSEGRFLFGVGAGWNLEEMANHGTDPTRRFGLLRERVESMKAVWASEEAEYHGAQVNFNPIIQNPKPVQKPHPPIHIGGVYPGGLRRAVRYGNGWMPILGRGEGDPRVWMTGRNEECDRVGRSSSEVEVSIYAAPYDQSQVGQLMDLGVDRLIFGLPSEDSGALLPLLDAISSVTEGAVGD